jgi:molecular chaperone DnaJ
VMSDSRADNRNYYEILGVLRTSSLADISAAYYALARSYHPDLASDQRLVEQFKSVTKAYEVLSDAQKRREYDSRLNRSRPNVPPRPHGNVITAELPVTPEEAAIGASCELMLKASEPCGTCRGVGSRGDLMCQVCDGQGSRPVRQPFTVRLPSGVRDGTILRFSCAKTAGFPGSLGRDLILCIRIRPSW